MICAIGDVHGEFDKLHVVIQKIEAAGFDFKKDTLIQIGDVVDGGKNTEGCINYLMSLQEQHPDHVIVLMGNHEHMMIDAIVNNSRVYGSFDQWYKQGGKATARSYGADKYTLPLISQDHINWMMNLPLTHETKSFIFVHAGLWDSDDVNDTPDFEKLWLRNKFIDSSFPWKKTIVYGHTVNDNGPRIRPHSIGIDTMHHGYGWITAALLDDDVGDVIQFIQSND